MFVAPTLSITAAADVFNFRLIDIIMEEPMEVDEATIEEEETAEPMDDDANDMEFEISPEQASDDATMDEAPSTTQDDTDGDELSTEDVTMTNTDEEIDSLATLLTQLELNVDVTMTDVTSTLQDLHLNENDDTKDITSMLAGMELNGKRKTSVAEEEQDDGELPTRASKRGGFWCGPPPRFNIGMAPPKELRCSRRHSRRNRR